MIDYFIYYIMNYINILYQDVLVYISNVLLSVKKWQIQNKTVFTMGKNLNYPTISTLVLSKHKVVLIQSFKSAQNFWLLLMSYDWELIKQNLRSFKVCKLSMWKVCLVLWSSVSSLSLLFHTFLSIILFSVSLSCWHLHCSRLPLDYISAADGEGSWNENAWSSREKSDWPFSLPADLYWIL